MKQNKYSRRWFLGGTAGTIGLAGLATSAAEGKTPFTDSDMASNVGSKGPDDEAYWNKIAENYDVTSKITNFGKRLLGNNGPAGFRRIQTTD